ncbi:hypothetical protein D3C73_559250 [compost metagenome]
MLQNPFGILKLGRGVKSQLVLRKRSAVYRTGSTIDQYQKEDILTVLHPHLNSKCSKQNIDLLIRFKGKKKQRDN